MPSKNTGVSGGEPSAPYEDARSRGQQIVADTLLSVAERILMQQGPGALSMRRVADEAGCSTMVLYSLFGNKNGLVDGLYLQGFKRLTVAIEALPLSPDPVSRILELCRTYRFFALNNRTHYDVMFGHAVPDYVTPPGSLLAARASMQPLVEAVEAAATAGQLTADNIEEFAMMLWSLCHGFVSLELAGYYNELVLLDALYDKALRQFILANAPTP